MTRGRGRAVPAQAGDDRWMRHALRLAARGEGFTRPNPPVGAVVVRNGGVVASGFHRRAGEAHAEAAALAAAGPAARGATVYVTLEPCSTWGRTPPCTDALIRHRVRRVVFAVPDPNPRHAGRAAGLLRAAGIDVTAGVCAEAAETLLAPFAKWVVTGRPYVLLKLACSLDGRIADEKGASKWITGPEAREAVQDLRSRSDAVLVGAGTACADNPSLLPRTARGGEPWRVIVDAAGRLPPEARVLTDLAAGRTIVASTRSLPEAREAAWRRGGADVWRLPASGGGLVSLPALLGRLGRRGVLRVLCEGGGQLAGQLLARSLVDEVALFLAPVFLGVGAVPAVAGIGWPLADAPRWRVTGTRRFGQDVLVRAVPADRLAHSGGTKGG